MASTARRPKRELKKEPKSDGTAKRTASDKERFLAHLEKMPIVTGVVKATGIGRSTYYSWKLQDRQFAARAQNAIDEGRRTINDVTLSKLLERIGEGNMTALIFWLKYNHPWFTERILHEHEHTHEHHLVGDGVMTPEQREQITRALITSGRVQSEKAQKLLLEKFILSLEVDDIGGDASKNPIDN